MRSRLLLSVGTPFVAAAAVVAVVVAAPASPAVAAPCTVAAAGDIADAADYRTGAAKTAAMITAANPVNVLALGDLAYPDGRPSDFSNYYAPTWGAFKSKTLPAPGNHEARTSGFAGIEGYFGDFADDNYGRTVCGWRIVMLNPYKGVSTAASYIAAQRKAYPDLPMAIGWHAPRFSSGGHGNNTGVQALWGAATAAKARIVLNGHDHDYERFAPMTSTGAKSATGTRQFVNGLGGHEPRPFSTIRANSEKRFTGQPAVLFLTLNTNGSYSWVVRSIDGTVRDSGAQAAMTVGATQLDSAKTLLGEIAYDSRAAFGGSADKSAQLKRIYEKSLRPLTGTAVISAEMTKARSLISAIQAEASKYASGSSSDKTARIARIHTLATTPLS